MMTMNDHRAAIKSILELTGQGVTRHSLDMLAERVSQQITKLDKGGATELGIHPDKVRESRDMLACISIMRREL